MYAALFGLVKNTDKNIGNIIETTVFSHYFHIDDSDRKHIYYARWKKNNQEFEVDLVWTDNRYKPKKLLEIKWSDKYVKYPNDLKGLLSMAKKHQLDTVFSTSKTKFDEYKYTHRGNHINMRFWPCSEFCYYMGEMLLQEGGINRKFVKYIKK